MAEKRFLFFPEDTCFIRPNTKDKPLREEVLVDLDAEIVEGEKPETHFVPVTRSFVFFLENFIVTHPIFDVRRGYPALAAALRIIDVAKEAEEAGLHGTWVSFDADDTRKMMRVFSQPKTKKEKDGKDDLSAAAMREMSSYESRQFRTFIESIMNPLTKPPELDSVEALPINADEEPEEASVAN